MSARGDHRKFLREVEDAGATLRKGRGSHILVYVDGRHVATIGNANRGFSGDEKASRRALRRAGLNL